MSHCVCGATFDKEYHEMRKNSLRIDKELKKTSKEYQSTVKLLLLGPGESGKSTIVKQMRIIHMSKFTNNERRERISDIKSNIRDIISSILNSMERYSIEFENENYKPIADFLLESLSENNFTFSESIWDSIEILWNDNGVKQCALRGHEYNLLDSAQYFLDRIPIIRKIDYLPNDQDILRCRVLTTGVLEIKFDVKHVHFHLFDVGGQRDERRKWIQCFNEVTAVIFVADISAFNMTLREDTKVNRLRESLELFRSTWLNRWLSRVSIILFLNKYDILVQKIQSGIYKLENYFPEYENFKTPKHINKSFRVDNEDTNVTRAKMFILKQFMDITNENENETNFKKFQSADAIHIPRRDSSINDSKNENSNYQHNTRRSYQADSIFTNGDSLSKFCIPYFTCAVDTENIERVFKGCYNILQREHLQKCGLINS